MTWILSRNSNHFSLVRVNIILRKDVPVSKGLTGYLDYVDAVVTDNSTIHHLLCRSLIIKEKLGLFTMVCV